MTNQTKGSRELRFYFKAILVCFGVWLILFEMVGIYACGLEYIFLTTPFDKMIPLVSEFVWIYQVCYILPLLFIFFIKDWHQVNLALSAFMLVSLISFIIYIVYPVGFFRPELGGSVSDRLLAFQYSIDFHPSANKLPSLHCAMAVILSMVCWKSCTRRIYEVSVGVLSTGIIISTLFVKQHIIYDVIAGIIMGILSMMLLKKYYDQNIRGDHHPIDGFFVLLRKCMPIYLLLLMILLVIYIFQII